jgi:hypothetical protein
MSNTIEFIAKNFPSSNNTPNTDGTPYYSDNLHRYLKKNPNNARVFAPTWDFMGGKKLVKPDFDNLYVGRRFQDDVGLCFLGSSMIKIRCTHGGKFHLSCFEGAYDIANWVDITDAFAEKYKKFGRCVFSDQPHQWSMPEADLKEAPLGFEQTCLCCGAKQIKKPVQTYEMDFTSSPAVKLV